VGGSEESPRIGREGRADDNRFDVAVVGAGPSGLLAAIRAAERGRSTVLLEKNRRPGAKILISGGGRCNLTHACDERGIAAAFGAAGRFLRSPLAAFGPAKLVDWLREEGVPTYVEAGGKVFPASDRAADVLDALLARLSRSGAQLATSEPVVDIRQAAQGFLVATAQRDLQVGAVIVATGGMSYPTCGTTGDGYGWLASLGHTIRTPRPALVPLTTEAAWIRRLAGIALPDVLVRVVDPGPASLLGAEGRAAASRTLAERRAAVLFTHFGLSGPAPMDVSRAVTLHDSPHRLRLLMDFLPDVRADDLDASIRRLAADAGRKRVASLLPRLFAAASLFPTRLAEALMEQASIPIDRRGAELGKVERAGLVTWLKHAEVVPSGTCGFGHAEVTTGGVELSEVDSRTMESKLVPGLYITGELLDLDGFIGGFNLQAAFSTGWQAGERA
jgi:hypothetical protein